jgi:hypothetical protein
VVHPERKRKLWGTSPHICPYLCVPWMLSKFIHLDEEYKNEIHFASFWSLIAFIVCK